MSGGIEDDMIESLEREQERYRALRLRGLIHNLIASLHDEAMHSLRTHLLIRELESRVEDESDHASDDYYWRL